MKFDYGLDYILIGVGSGLLVDLVFTIVRSRRQRNADKKDLAPKLKRI